MPRFVRMMDVSFANAPNAVVPEVFYNTDDIEWFTLAAPSRAADREALRNVTFKLRGSNHQGKATVMSRVDMLRQFLELVE